VGSVPDVIRIFQLERMRSFLILPLHSISGFLGGLSVGWDEPGALTLEEVEITSEVASQIAIAIEQARLMEETRQHAEELDQRVRTRTAQLETANKELEAFAYSVSHDLRAPLRGIDGWSLALAEDYGGQLDQCALGYIDRVRSEAQRMGLLIDDILQLSRVGRTEIEFAPVDLAAVAGPLASALAEANPGRRIEFIIHPKLWTTGDARLLEVALTNLLSNAVKFTGPCPNARIELGRKSEAGGPVFYVRDNGVGFDMAYANKLFGAFRRLHKATEFPGTGIGLSLVQRIIHRHGGRIWAEAELSKGATFYFTIGEASWIAAK